VIIISVRVVVRPCGILGGAFLPPTKEELFARERQIKESVGMRLKLVFIASSLAAIAGAGSCIALVLGVFSRQALSNPGLLVISTFLLPLAAIVFASFFVYRHTARRRRLQAFLTLVLATLLTVALLIVTSIVTTRRDRMEPVRPAGPQIAS
jgi:NADH:ubiquinone oxidoreductase subunit H